MIDYTAQREHPHKRRNLIRWQQARYRRLVHEIESTPVQFLGMANQRNLRLLARLAQLKQALVAAMNHAK